MLRGKGFDFMKRIFVVAVIIGLLLAMFVPAYLSVRFGQKENVVKGKLRTLYEASEIYRKIQRPAEYPESIVDLEKTLPPLIETESLDPKQLGYQFAYDRLSDDRFSIVAKPKLKFLTGHHTFFIDETGIIRINGAAGDPIDA